MRISNTQEFVKWFWVSIIIWVIAIGISFSWNARQTWISMIAQGKSEGQMAFTKDIAYRIWVTEMGGVYVPVSESVQPNPYLKVNNRDITSTEGQPLTLVNPAYMTRMVFDLTEHRYGIKGHITSLNLMNPNNVSDDWEKRALRTFETDRKEVSQLMDIDGEPFLRFMRPMIVQKGCLKCHAHMGYQIGDVRGGISVSVPMTANIARAKGVIANLAGGHLLILMLGISLLILSKRQIMNYLFQKNLYEAELNSLRNYLSNIIDSMPSMLVGVDVNGDVCQWNQTAIEFTGIKIDDAIGKHITELLPEFQSDMTLITESIQTGDIKKLTNKLVEKEEKQLYENITIYPLLSDGIEGAAIRIDDVTKEHELEEQLIHSRKMDAIGQLAGGVAHDFNNMLGGIMGAAELIKIQKCGGDKKCTKLVDMIMQASGRASELTSKLLAFGRKGKLVSTSIDVHSIINDAVTILKRSVDKKVHISVFANAEHFTVVGDNSGLQNVLINMGINSSHAMPDGGELIIETRNISLTEAYCSASSFDIYPGEYIEIEVKDTGCGIPFEDLGKIFDPFYTTKPVGKGTGLGLASAYGMIQDHHGAVNVYSEKNVGTSFHIQLPCSDEFLTPTDFHVETFTGSGKILLVDDEELIRISGEWMLTELGYDVLVASDGAEAVDIFQQYQNEIDIVLMDMIMPIMNGHEAFFKMKEIDNNCRVIISSGFTNNNRTNELMEAGLCGFIKKPYRIHDLSKMLVEVKER